MVVALILAAIAGVAGCGLVATRLSDSALAGEWSSVDGATLYLSADGSFTVSEVPDDAWFSSDWSPANTSGAPIGEPIEATGAWERVADGAWRGSPVIQFTTGGHINQLVLVSAGPPLIIGFVLGDPDSLDVYEFTKVD